MLLEFQNFRGLRAEGFGGVVSGIPGFTFLIDVGVFLGSWLLRTTCHRQPVLQHMVRPHGRGLPADLPGLLCFDFFRFSATGSAVAEAICRAFCVSNATHKF